MMSLKKRAAYATCWSAMEIAVRYGIHLLVMIALARLLDPADFGLMAMVGAFIVLAALMVDGGLGSALVQKQNPTADDETTVFHASIGISVLLAASLCLLSPAVAAFYARPELTGLTRLLALTLPLGALAAVPNAVLTLRLDFRTRAQVELVASLVSGAAALTLAWQGFGVWSLAWQAVIGAAIRAVLLIALARWRPSGRFQSKAFASLFRFGGYLLLANALNVVSVRLQSALIGRLFDARALGFYTLAQETQQAPAQFINSLLNRVGLPVFSVVAGQREQLRAALRLSLRLSMFVFVPTMAGLALCSHVLIAVFYGSKWAAAAPVLSILAISAIFWPMHVLNLAALGARGKSRMIFKLEIIKFLSCVPLVVAGSLISVLAVAWAVLASNILCVLINTYHSRALLDYPLASQLQDQIGTFMLTLSACAAAAVALYWIPSPLPALVAAVAAAIATFVAAAILTKAQTLLELASLLKTMTSGKDNPEKVAAT